MPTNNIKVGQNNYKMQQINDKNVYTVTEVNYAAKQTLEQLEVWVIGEIASFRQNPNWRFYYLDLKDETTILPCIADAKVFEQFQGEPSGQKILAYGFLTLYEPRGQYQLKILKIEAAGVGILQKQLEELIKKLKGEGLFDAEHKVEIPLYPKRVCVVTSQGSDAENDFRRHTTLKFPIIDVETVDVRVQGSKSVPELLRVLPDVDKKGYDVIVITRGGGSLEDLAAFNDEQVTRCIYALETPTIVAIGHEANESLAEWVADRRASTPTDAANIVAFGYNQVLEKLQHIRTKLFMKSSYFFSENFQRLDTNFRQLAHMSYYFKDLPHKLNGLQQTLIHSKKFLIADTETLLSTLRADLEKQTGLILDSKSETLMQMQKSLTILSPENTLSRGYAIATNGQGKVIKSAKTVDVGDAVSIRLSDGKLGTVVKNKA